MPGERSRDFSALIVLKAYISGECKYAVILLHRPMRHERAYAGIPVMIETITWRSDRG
ncbi:MAG TPA: hypothetical protein DEB17_02085 [Chlorobaculum sp.]|uniref:Uncharacterized protein n=1 Tax=Chlorobaculum tepidum (strain ATCC 49652 / DSM 12025 / NBRC 103806 / TLS) TaxID=194439 RepID=Q8KEK0_CHLTE|nr:hypothetical protein CT0688 [Chlorobaculum tepidum TLS]HBU22788.1 hypothetical protein [Chlorobaculum sp.]